MGTSRTSNMNIALISCTSKKLFFLLAALVVAAAYGSQIQGPNATTCLDLKKAYQQSSCCNQTISQFATFDTVNLTCDDLLSSYTGSSCCSAELTKSATLNIQTAEPSAEPTAEPTAEPSAELSVGGGCTTDADCPWEFFCLTGSGFDGMCVN